MTHFLTTVHSTVFNFCTSSNCSAPCLCRQQISTCTHSQSTLSTTKSKKAISLLLHRQHGAALVDVEEKQSPGNQAVCDWLWLTGINP